jgi:hypothetical protein
MSKILDLSVVVHRSTQASPLFFRVLTILDT